MNSFFHRTWTFWRWLDPAWWRFLRRDCTGWRNFRCRVRGHPRGEVFYAYGDATEPDHHCKDCGEYIG